jgi:hypothetical protein
MRDKGRQGMTGDDKGLQGITRGDKGLEGRQGKANSDLGQNQLINRSTNQPILQSLGQRPISLWLIISNL